jgi:2-hydroxychromene-2-carboxylate isomerase
VDRLGLLEERLRGEGVELPSRTVRTVDVEPAADGQSLEFYFSFRSPYSYLAVEPILQLIEDRGVPLRIRPVLPMVMRGLSVPKAKVMYIARDCARLARQQGTPFGRIADPLGPGIERCLALFSVAEPELQAPLVRSISRGAWSEGLDITYEPHLRSMVERAGMDWPDTLDIEGGLEMAEANRQALLALGLWGVPSFRLGDRTAWGQDRIDRVRGWFGG